jgi:hypothetical protein
MQLSHSDGNQQLRSLPKIMMFQLTQNVRSTKALPDNPQTTVTTDSQLLTPLRTNSLTPIKEKVNGGKFDSPDNTGLTESELRTDKAAAVTDFQLYKSLLMMNNVEKYQVMPRTDNGMKLNVNSHSLVRKLDLSCRETLIFQSKDLKLLLEQVRSKSKLKDLLELQRLLLQQHQVDHTLYQLTPRPS